MLTRIFIVVAWIGLIFGALWTSNIRLLPKQEDQTLNIYAWPEIILPEVIEAFERDTGIKVKRHYFTSNEELLITLKANRGKGYDFILPSDYAVKMLIQEDLLKPLDHSKIDFHQHLNPILMGHDYDPQNTYSLPYQWDVFGFGIDADYFEKHNLKPSWNLIFNSEHSGLRLAMVNDPIEAVNLGAQYLFGPSPKLQNIKAKQQLRKLLENQKEWVEAYAGLRADYLLATRNCNMALCLSSMIFRSSKNHPHVKFVIPEEWSFLSIENVCIPKASKKDDLVYAFINYIYRPENLGKDCNRFFTFPSTTNTIPYLDLPPDFINFLKNSHKHTGKFYFMYHLIPEKDMREIWVDIKS